MEGENMPKSNLTTLCYIEKDGRYYFFFAANDVSHTSVEKKSLVLVENAKNSCEVVLKITDCLNCKNVWIFTVFNFFNLLVSVTNCNHAAVVKPGIIGNVLKNFVTVNVFGCEVDDFDFRELIINIADDILCCVKNISCKKR